MPATSISRTGVVVRSASADEYDDIRLFANCSHDLRSPDRRDLLFVALEDLGSCNQVTGRPEGQTIIGYGSIHRYRDLLWIAVHPAHRRRGVATRILDAILQHHAAVGGEVPATNLPGNAFAAGRGRLVDYDRRTDMAVWAFQSHRRPDDPPRAGGIVTCSCAEHRASWRRDRPSASGWAG